MTVTVTEMNSFLDWLENKHGFKPAIPVVRFTYKKPKRNKPFTRPLQEIMLDRNTQL